MEDILDYIASACSRAWHTSWSKIGLGVNIVIFCISFFFYTLFNWSSIDVVRSGVIVVCVFIFTFMIYFVWEVRAAFPNIRLKKTNSRNGAEILIRNDDVSDLTDLRVDIIQKTWITKGGSIRIPINPNERSLDLGDINKVNYGGGVVSILVGSGKNGNATFHTNPLTLDTGHEHFDNADHSTYGIVIQVCGKIDDRPIVPRKLQGRLNYLRAEQEFVIDSFKEKKVLQNVYSRMEWE